MKGWRYRSRGQALAELRERSETQDAKISEIFRMIELALAGDELLHGRVDDLALAHLSRAGIQVPPASQPAEAGSLAPVPPRAAVATASRHGMHLVRPS